MKKPKGAEFIKVGGEGGEATVDIELRTRFPGVGGVIQTRSGVIAALRAERESAPKAGHKMFLRHMLIKKLEDYYYRSGYLQQGCSMLHKAGIYRYPAGCNSYCM